MIVGFDVDGVVAKSYFGLHRFLTFRGCNRLISNAFGGLIYKKFRFVNKETREVIRQLRSKRHSIIIITYPALPQNKKMVESWLEENGVPFDKVVEVRREESPLEFKARAIMQENCDFYVEDGWALAENVALRAPQARVIHYRKKRDLNILKELS